MNGDGMTDFQRTVLHYLAADYRNRKKLAEHFESVLVTVDGWANGTVKPHYAMQRQIAIWISGRR